jgi:hypothetical protein
MTMAKANQFVRHPNLFGNSLIKLIDKKDLDRLNKAKKHRKRTNKRRLNNARHRPPRTHKLPTDRKSDHLKRKEKIDRGFKIAKKWRV